MSCPFLLIVKYPRNNSVFSIRVVNTKCLKTKGLLNLCARDVTDGGLYRNVFLPVVRKVLDRGLWAVEGSHVETLIPATLGPPGLGPFPVGRPKNALTNSPDHQSTIRNGNGSFWTARSPHTHSQRSSLLRLKKAKLRTIPSCFWLVSAIMTTRSPREDVSGIRTYSSS